MSVTAIVPAEWSRRTLISGTVWAVRSNGRDAVGCRWIEQDVVDADVKALPKKSWLIVFGQRTAVTMMNCFGNGLFVENERENTDLVERDLAHAVVRPCLAIIRPQHHIFRLFTDVSGRVVVVVVCLSALDRTCGRQRFNLEPKGSTRNRVKVFLDAMLTLCYAWRRQSPFRFQ